MRSTLPKQKHLGKVSLLCILVLLPAQVACSSATPLTPPLGTATASATTTPSPAATDTRYVLTTPSAVPRPTKATPTEVPADASPEAGLVYRIGTGFWIVDAQGQSTQLIDRTDAVISPDGSGALYWETNDAWLADFSTGERRNLTQSTDRHESNLQWWPGRPEYIIFVYRQLEGQEKPPATEGYLAVVGVNGQGYRVLDDQTLIGGPSGQPAASSDGQTIAYGGGGTGMLYHWDTGPEVFDPRDFGLSDEQGELLIANPSWAPDGQRLAWIVHRESQFGIAVFDLQLGTAWLGHFYDPIGMDGFPPAVTWSPDGRRMAVVAMAADPQKMGLWILDSASLQGERHLGRASNPVWSPDGDWLAFAGSPDESEWRLWLANTGTWALEPLALMPDAYLAGWIRPSGPASGP